MKVLVTGAAGFIGYHTVERLLQENAFVVGLDNINDYYDVSLKYARLSEHGIDKEAVMYNKLVDSQTNPNYQFIKLNLEDSGNVRRLFEQHQFDYVIALAAQAGVRYSLTSPEVYVDSNIKGFMTLLEACRSYPVKHLVYASTSSVYGMNGSLPFSESDSTQHPISLYAATKKANEMMAHSYSHLFAIPTTGLRFFTVYGPWGRPDMALFKFTKAIINDEAIDVYNNGEMLRDFTYVADIVENIFRLLPKPPVINGTWDNLNPDPSDSSAPYRILNIGNNKPVKLTEYIAAIEYALGKTAVKNMLPLQPGDVLSTHASIDKLTSITGFLPQMPVKDGVKKFVDWYVNYHKPVCS